MLYLYLTQPNLLTHSLGKIRYGDFWRKTEVDGSNQLLGSLHMCYPIKVPLPQCRGDAPGYFWIIWTKTFVGMVECGWAGMEMTQEQPRAYLFPICRPLSPSIARFQSNKKKHRIKANISSPPSLSQSGSSTLSELPMQHFHLPGKLRDKQKKMIRFLSWGIRQNRSYPRYCISYDSGPQLTARKYNVIETGALWVYFISFQIVPTCMISLTLNPEKIKSTTTDCFIFTDLFIQTRPRPAFGRLGLGG